MKLRQKFKIFNVRCSNIKFTLKIDVIFGGISKIYHAVSYYGLGNKLFFTFSRKLEVMSTNQNEYKEAV